MVRDDLTLIKKYYGEDFMHFCKANFSTLLEKPGLLFDLIENNFVKTKHLYNDLLINNKQKEFKDFIYNLYDTPLEDNSVKTGKNPFELMEEAGYKLYECKTEEDIQYFKKYYAPREELCTFLGDRLSRCYVFFAVRKDADTVKREDVPERDKKDGYGTSVISLQFDRGAINILSIKNRYNHTVKHPDATFSNDLEKIIPGLTESFRQYYGFNIRTESINGFEIPSYVLAGDGRYYKYNNEIHNVYYCPDNIIIDNYKVIDKYAKEKERYVVFDYFVLDLKEKTVKPYDSGIVDSFPNQFTNALKYYVKNNPDGTKKIDAYFRNGNIATITLNKFNNIISYENNNIKHIDKRFLIFDTTLKNLIINNVEEIDGLFLDFNECLEHFEANNLKAIGTDFLEFNKSLKILSLPNLEVVKNHFCSETNIEELYLPKLKVVGSNFMYNNSSVKIIDLPKLEKAGNYFFCRNESVRKVNLPNITEFGDSCLYFAKCINKLNVPNLIYTGDNFIVYNNNLKHVDFPLLEKVGCNFLSETKLEEANFPSLISAPNVFMSSCLDLKKFSAPVLQKAGDEFLAGSTVIKTITLPEIVEMGNNALEYAEFLEEFSAPKLETTGTKFLYFNKNLKKVEVPNIQNFNVNSLYVNKGAKLKILKQLYTNERNQLVKMKQIVEGLETNPKKSKILTRK